MWYRGARGAGRGEEGWWDSEVSSDVFQIARNAAVAVDGAVGLMGGGERGAQEIYAFPAIALRLQDCGRFAEPRRGRGPKASPLLMGSGGLK